MNRLELKIPPVFVAALAIGLMWGLRVLLPGLTVDIPFAGVAFRVLGMTALTLVILGGFEFRKKRTTVDPHRINRASALVTDGIYRFTRNPMYLGMLLFVIGAFLRLENMAGFLGIAAFAAYMNRFQIAPEERHLTATFGEEYLTYIGRVRRWL